jgi:hypothetical protein
MAISTPIQHPCPRCAQPVATVLHKSFVIEDDASLRTIVENRFHLLECARCGERRPFEADFLVTNRTRELFIQVITRDEEVAVMIESMREMLGTAPVHARIVASRDELVEKVRLWSLGLDDVAMEVVKYFMRAQLGDLEGRTQRFFEKAEGEELVFSVFQPGQPAGEMRLPLRVYHNIIRQFGTAAHAREYEVDERLARHLCDQKRGAPKE